MKRSRSTGAGSADMVANLTLARACGGRCPLAGLAVEAVRAKRAKTQENYVALCASQAGVAAHMDVLDEKPTDLCRLYGLHLAGSGRSVRQTCRANPAGAGHDCGD